MSHFKRIQQLATEHREYAVASLHATHKHARKLFKKHKLILRDIRHHAVRTATVATVATGILAGPVLAANNTTEIQPFPEGDSRLLQHELIGSTPSTLSQIQVGPASTLESPETVVPSRFKEITSDYKPNLSAEQEASVAALIHEQYGITASAELEGIRLNATQGIIAGEQHLPLYPGDTLSDHASDPTKQLTGMVPGRPSWGYFAQKKSELTSKDIENERYYIAAQTFLAPGWTEHVEQYYQWFKYRKMIVINPETAQAVVVDIADAGPSPHTGRTFGGSNEVLMGLGLGKKRTGHVYVFFVNDPNDSVRLGPLGRSE